MGILALVALKLSSACNDIFWGIPSQALMRDCCTVVAVARVHICLLLLFVGSLRLMNRLTGTYNDSHVDESMGWPASSFNTISMQAIH